MIKLLKRFWMLCLVPLVIPMMCLPWQGLVWLAVIGAFSFAWRYSE